MVKSNTAPGHLVGLGWTRPQKASGRRCRCFSGFERRQVDVPHALNDFDSMLIDILIVSPVVF